MVKYLIAVFCLLIATSFSTQPTRGVKSRLIPVHVKLNGKMVLKGSSSDDGSLDPDEIWNLFQDHAEASDKQAGLKETSNLDSKMISKHPDFDGVYRLTAEDGSPIELEITHSGVVFVDELRLRQFDFKSKKWMLDGAQIKELFSTRLLSRELVRKLKHP